MFRKRLDTAGARLLLITALLPFAVARCSAEDASEADVDTDAALKRCSRGGHGCEAGTDAAAADAGVGDTGAGGAGDGSTAGGGQGWSGVLPPARATDWSQAGLPGGIPHRTTVCADVLTTDTTAQIQTKMNNCSANQVVQFPAGTWNLTSSIYANKGIVLRGAGPKQTTIKLGAGTNIFFGASGTGGLGGYPGGLGVTNWTGGLTKGSAVLTVASSAGMAVGQQVVIDQLNNTNLVFPIGNEGASGSSGRNGVGFEGSYARAQLQMVEVTGINDSTHITVNPPVDYTHDASLAPQVFYWNTAEKGNTQYAGVEDLNVDANSQDFAIAFRYCSYCWVKNVSVVKVARTAVDFFYAYRGEVRDSYLAGPLIAGGPTQYGIEIASSTLIKVENNIMFGITSSLLPDTSTGMVVGYNYAYNPVAGNMFNDFEPHQVHNYYHLYEGNVLDGMAFDNVWGSGSQHTVFRNRSSGLSPNKTNFRTPLSIGAHERYMNIIGNVLGTPGYHTRYQVDDTNATGSDDFIMQSGFWNRWEYLATPYDTVTKTSLMRWGNWDAATYKANGNTNGVRWCVGSGAGNAACTASETASTDPTFPGLPSPSATLPSSFYLSSKPAWFGTAPWPPIGPDVTCGTNCIANTANHAAKIPAQLCYEKTAKDASGYLTGFDANTCY